MFSCQGICEYAVCFSFEILHYCRQDESYLKSQICACCVIVIELMRYKLGTEKRSDALVTLVSR